VVDIEREIGDKDVRVTVKDLHLADPKLERVLHVFALRLAVERGVSKAVTREMNSKHREALCA
jgi:hypothetical protein